MFSLLGNLKHKSSKNDESKIPLKELKSGVNCFDDYIILNQGDTLKIYDRVCDHNGGKIISKDGKHICPMHRWEFDPLKGIYKNGIEKKKKKFEIHNNNIIIEKIKETPYITQSEKNSEIKVRFFNHAFLQVETKDFKFATDPWAIGPSFNTGWWLKYKTKSDWISELNSCNFIYISHNHPDHLHPLTLNKIRKDIPIIVPAYKTDCTGIYVESLGFKNVIRLELTKEYVLDNTNLFLSILKSGDFREDSGIYFSIGNFTSLFSVDTVMINFNKLPNVDLFASGFAGGASGYPLMYDNFNKKEQIAISENNRKFLLKKKTIMLKEIKPKYFLPYAGFFENKLQRDIKIKLMNKKNNISNYFKACKDIGSEILNIENNDEFYFKDQKLLKKLSNKNSYFKDIPAENYLSFFKNSYQKIDNQYLKEYFSQSNFKDDLTLLVSLVDNNFENSELDFEVDFCKAFPKFNIIKNFEFNKIKKNIKNRILYLKCRKESFLNTIYNKEPWEDLSIGFQCKVIREPNVYNAKFWYHFTNKYITKKNVRMVSECSNCESINTFFDKELFLKEDKSQNKF